MTLHLQLPAALELWLVDKAKMSGRTIEDIALKSLKRNLENETRLLDLQHQLHLAFDASGMTENELTELLTSELREMRKEKHETMK